MILESLVGLSLIVAASFESQAAPAVGHAPSSMSVQQKSAMMQTLVRSATECILHAVAADPKKLSPETTDLRDLIVASMPTCADRMRAMIDAHDQLFGEGSGEAFFMGPYLDALPAMVARAVKDGPH
jgi:hypothetical protein